MSARTSAQIRADIEAQRPVADDTIWLTSSGRRTPIG